MFMNLLMHAVIFDSEALLIQSIVYFL